MIKTVRYLIYAGGIALVFAGSALAAETGMPWESPLNKLIDSLTGPVAKAVGVICIVIAGFGIALGESGGGLKRLFQIVFGLSIAFTASSFVATLFGFSSGMVIP